MLLDGNGVAERVTHAVDECQAKFLMRDFTPTKAQRDFDLIACFQKAPDIAHLDIEVALVSARAEFDFLGFNNGLPGLGFGGFFLLLIAEFAVIYQAADRGRGVGGDFHQVYIALSGHAQSFLQGDDTQRFIVRAVQAHLRSGDFSRLILTGAGAGAMGLIILKFKPIEIEKLQILLAENLIKQREYLSASDI